MYGLYINRLIGVNKKQYISGTTGFIINWQRVLQRVCPEGKPNKLVYGNVFLDLDTFTVICYISPWRLHFKSQI